MARKEGLRPIGDSVKKIIEKIRKEREERQKKGKPIRTQPKLPGLKKGGDAKSPKPGTYEYYLLNKPKHTPAPIKPQKMNKGGSAKKPIKIKKITIGIGKLKDYPGIKKLIEMNKKGKKRFAEGGDVFGKMLDKKFSKYAESKETQLHSKDADEGYNRAERRAGSETMQAYKKNKKTGKKLKEGGMIPKTPKQKKFAALAEPRDKITYADKIAGATGKSKKMKQGGMARGGGAAIRGNNFKGVY